MVASAPKLLIYKELVSMTPPVNTYVGFNVAAPALVPALVPRQALDAATLGWR